MNTDVHEYVSRSVHVLYTCISSKAPGILQYGHFAVFHLLQWGLERINRDKRGITVHLVLDLVGEIRCA